MSLESFDAGDTKMQIVTKEINYSDAKRPSIASKSVCGEYFVSGKKIKLDQFGQELLDAENHCNQLKAELQQFRKELPLLSRSVETSLESVTSSRIECVPKKEFIPVKEIQSPSIRTHPLRQTSPYIGTDNTGAAVVTINNILNGITESVNRLSQLHSHFGKDLRPHTEQAHEEQMKDVTKEKNGTKINHEYLVDHAEDSNTSLIEEIPVCSPEVEVKPKDSPRKKNKTKTSKQRSVSNQPQDSTLSIQTQKKTVKVTAKRVDKKAQLHTVKTSMILRDSRSTVISKRRKCPSPRKSALNSQADSFGSSKPLKNTTTAKLVELYHNKAAKTSDSDDEEDGDKKKNKRNNKVAGKQQQKGGGEIVPPLQIGEEEKKHYKNIKEIIEANEKELDYQEPAAPRTQCSILSRSYELPTIASKLKEVAKSYLHAFNFHMIPFCPAASTSPSHNIGINIQQVLNIIKTRQPVWSISPTLAHNIGLAAEKLNSQPLHALVSTLSSRMTYGKSQCPLLKSNLNYQQLQEMAKEIPEEDGADEQQQQVTNDNNRQDYNVPSHEEPTKDVPSGSKGQVVWSLDQNRQLQCTCLPTQGVGFKQVLHKYSNANNTSNFSYLDYNMSQIPSNTPISAANLKPRNTKASSLRRIQRVKEQSSIIKPTKTTSSPENISAASENAIRKKNLKEVLQNLHDEFDSLNRKYETLSQQINDNKSEANNDALKELETIEAELTKKEEEINMVVALYKEVAALKEQVKSLRKRASQSTIGANKPVEAMSGSKAALHLTKLLRQIQNIQSHCGKVKV